MFIPVAGFLTAIFVFMIGYLAGRSDAFKEVEDKQKVTVSIEETKPERVSAKFGRNAK